MIDLVVSGEDELIFIKKIETYKPFTGFVLYWLGYAVKIQNPDDGKEYYANINQVVKRCIVSVIGERVPKKEEEKIIYSCFVLAKKDFLKKCQECDYKASECTIKLYYVCNGIDEFFNNYSNH